MRTPTKMTHDEMVSQWKKDPEFLRACEKIKPEFEALARVLDAAKSSEMTQGDASPRKHTHRNTVSKIERCCVARNLPTRAMSDRQFPNVLSDSKRRRLITYGVFIAVDLSTLC